MFSKFFWKPLFSTIHVTLIIMSRKYFFEFRSPNLPFDIRFWTRGFLLVMRSRKAGFPFATRARKRELSIQEVRIENDSDKKFSKTKFFQSFPGNHFSPAFMLLWSLWAENIFRDPAVENFSWKLMKFLIDIQQGCMAMGPKRANFFIKVSDCDGIWRSRVQGSYVFGSLLIVTGHWTITWLSSRRQTVISTVLDSDCLWTALLSTAGCKSRDTNKAFLLDFKWSRDIDPALWFAAGLHLNTHCL